jgi:hypothetical protein
MTDSICLTDVSIVTDIPPGNAGAMKTVIARRLAAIASTRLFGHEGWLVDREASIKLNEALQAMGLCEQVSANTSKNTTLGNEVDVDLHMVFMGLWAPWDMVIILEERGLLERG